MFDFIKQYFHKRSLAALEEKVLEINELEPEIQKLTDEELKAASLDLKSKIREGMTLDEALPRAFALVREAAKRTLGQRPFDVQLLGGMVLHQGAIAEMVTGEGKTLAAVAPAYLNALSGNGTHVVTVNEYLARRDAVWMGQIYRALGLTVACLVPNAAFMYDPEWKIPEGAEDTYRQRARYDGSVFGPAGVFETCIAPRGVSRRHYLRHEPRIRLRLFEG